MKQSLVFLLLLAICHASRADLIKSLKYDLSNFIISGNLSEAQTDSTPDSTTVRATLVNNPLRSCWEFRLWNHLTGSANLTAGLDVTTGTDITAEFFIYPNGHPQSPKYFWIYGTDIRNVNYSLANATFAVNFRPVAPAVTASHAGGFTAIGGIDFPYYGMGKIINYTPPIIGANAIWDDVSRRQHPSSKLLLGTALRVDGVNNEPVTVEFFLGNQYANRWSYDLNQARGYLDGIIPPSGFSSTLGDPGITITTDVANESFKKLLVVNYNFSAHDIQAGVFLEFTNVVREANGLRLYWNPQTTNLYTIQYFPTINGPTNILATNLAGPSFLDTNAPTSTERYYRLSGQSAQ